MVQAVLNPQDQLTEGKVSAELEYSAELMFYCNNKVNAGG